MNNDIITRLLVHNAGCHSSTIRISSLYKSLKIDSSEHDKQRQSAKHDCPTASLPVRLQAASVHTKTSVMIVIVIVIVIVVVVVIVIIIIMITIIMIKIMIPITTNEELVLG